MSAHEFLKNLATVLGVAALTTVLHDVVVPTYYDRDHDGLPTAWIARMKRAIQTLGWRFSAERMVMDYVLKSYIPAAGGTSSDVPRPG